jgi:hypothetical protein
MAVESPEDKAVDGLISDLQATLDKLKAAQSKDVSDETAEESGETAEETAEQPKDLKQAGNKAYGLMKASRLKK